MYGDEDAILVKSFKLGDEKAFDHLFEKYQLALYSICYRYTRNSEDARELIHDIFIKVYNNLKKFNEKCRFFTWLYRITVNTCISFKRKEHRKEITDIPEYKTDTMPMEERIRMKKAIDDALTKLPDRQRMVFILRNYDGYKFDEIGEIMSITTGTAKANYHHAIKKLRIFLKDWV